MTKKLLAVAIAGVLAAPLAQAQTANVTLYGRLNMDAQVIINAKQDNTAGTKTNLYQVNSNSSRLGVRGTESLGGGLNAIFQVEERFNAESGGNVAASGDTYVGLQGGWGTAKIGYFLTPYDDVAPVFGSVPTLLTSILATGAIWSNSGGTGIDAGSFDSRAANSLRYDTPRMAGFSFAAHVAGKDTGGGGTLGQARNHAYLMSYGLTYRNGPIKAAAAYEVHNAFRGTGTGSGNLGEKLQDQGLTIAGSYNFGPVTIGAVGEWIEYDIAAGGNLKRNMWGVSATGNVGSGQVYAAYFKGNNGKGSAQCTTNSLGITSCPSVGNIVLGPNTSAQMWEISYTYPLSKRTLLYTGYVMIDNNDNASYNFNVGAVAGLCKGNAQNSSGNNVGCGNAARPQGALAGIVHFF